MEKADGRKVSAGVLEEKRKVAMKLRRQGMRYGEIAEMVEVHERRWDRGVGHIKSKVRGRSRQRGEDGGVVRGGF